MPINWRTKDTTHTHVRPSGMRRKPSANTRYMQMLLDLDSVPKWHNIVAAICAWMLLAGFVIFPGTFTSIQNIDEEGENLGDLEKWILHRVRNLPLLIVAGVCSGLGAIGMVFFWIRWRDNYVWICNRVFLPGTLHSLAGLLSTIINVYTAQKKQWSVTARVSGIVEGGCFVVCGILFIFYSNWMLERVKRRHRRQFGEQDDTDGFVEKMKKKAQEPSPEPGRLV